LFGDGYLPVEPRVFPCRSLWAFPDHRLGYVFQFTNRVLCRVLGIFSPAFQLLKDMLGKAAAIAFLLVPLFVVFPGEEGLNSF